MSGEITCGLSLRRRESPDCFSVLFAALFAAYLGAALANVLSVVSQRGLTTCHNTLPAVLSAPQSQCEPLLQEPVPNSSLSSQITLLPRHLPGRRSWLSKVSMSTVGPVRSRSVGPMELLTEGQFDEHYLVNRILPVTSPSRSSFKSSLFNFCVCF